MPTAENARVQYEAGQNAVAMSALSDSGDATLFEGTASPWSRRAGFDVVIRPNGLVTGGAITPAASGSDDVVDVAAGTAYIGGVLVTWSAATDVSITRGLTTDTNNITSITVTSGGTVTAVSGVDGTAYSETRAADGGPPLIATTSIEIGQVRTASITADAISASEIFQVPGSHQERFDYPLYDVDYFAGTVTFTGPLPLIHTAGVPKAVYASYASPIFSDINKASDFVPPENSYSVTSTQIYGRTLGSTTSSLGAGSFTGYVEDGVTDGLISLEGQILWFKFYPDKAKAPYILSQGKLGITRSFPAGDQIQVAATINAEDAARNVAA
jgi:hypothetical protein